MEENYIKINILNNHVKCVYFGKTCVLPNLKLNGIFFFLLQQQQTLPDIFLLNIAPKLTLPSAFESGSANFCVYSAGGPQIPRYCCEVIENCLHKVRAARAHKALTIIKARVVAEPLAASDKAIFHVNV